ncbi:hypothetical protein BD626DRAFT_404949 [Schizophyllum amplum]|uniref:37S ribosomal protein mrp10, mitochondrial n=1 Tax=Schizophyllum amplum TaxID=97359 RepID=A0A550CAA1_9AGAR|nr:hypothetical protein BD626DRAFT_404949 [Auriculariopsis ampla]
MTIHIKNIKVRPKKKIQRTPCIYQLNSMLGCWAAHGDVMSAGECASHAQMLFECMRTMPPSKPTHKPTINYHLSRLGNRIQ